MLKSGKFSFFYHKNKKNIELLYVMFVFVFDFTFIDGISNVINFHLNYIYIKKKERFPMTENIKSGMANHF